MSEPIVLRAREKPKRYHNAHVVFQRQKLRGTSAKDGLSVPIWDHHVVIGKVENLQTYLKDPDTALVVQHLNYNEMVRLVEEARKHRGAPQPIETAVREFIRGLDREPAEKNPEEKRSQRDRKDFFS